MSNNVIELNNLTNDDLKKRLASQIALEDWTDECGKCGCPKLLHKDYVLHRDAACTKERERSQIFSEKTGENVLQE